jgi:hypothetical protein
MKIIKLGIISVIAFALLISIFSLFFPANVRISKAIDITASKEKLEVRLDSLVKASKGGTGKKEAESGWDLYPSGRPNTYTAHWYMDFHLGWLPWNKFSGLMLEKRYGPAMEMHLDSLKTSLENVAISPATDN